MQQLTLGPPARPSGVYRLHRVQERLVEAGLVLLGGAAFVFTKLPSTVLYSSFEQRGVVRG